MAKKTVATKLEKPTWKRITIRLGDIDLYEHNPKFSTEKQSSRIKESENKYGQPIPFLVSPFYKVKGNPKERVKLYDGHQRYGAWIEKHGADFEIEANQASRHLTDEEIQDLILTLTIGAVGSLDWDILSSWDYGILTNSMDDDYLSKLRQDASNVKFLFEADPNKPIDDFQEIDESIASEVEMIKCPHCKKTFPK